MDLEKRKALVEGFVEGGASIRDLEHLPMDADHA
jgi:hypothetical protein